MNYALSDSEGEESDEEARRPGRSKVTKRRKVSPESEDDFDEEQSDGGFSFQSSSGHMDSYLTVG